MNHIREYAVVYVFLGWSVFCMFAFGGQPTGSSSSSEYARSLR